MSERVARSRQLVARGRKLAGVARVMQVSRQAIYRTPRCRTDREPRPVSGPVDRAIVAVAKANPTDGSRMVAALSSRELHRPVSRKRAQRVMRSERLLQRHRPLRRRRRPGYFRVERPDQLWHMDMTSVWVAEHGWCYLNAAIDCCTREIPAWGRDREKRQSYAASALFDDCQCYPLEPSTGHRCDCRSVSGRVRPWRPSPAYTAATGWRPSPIAR